MELMGRAPFNNNPEEIGVKERDQNMELQTDNFTEHSAKSQSLMKE